MFRISDNSGGKVKFGLRRYGIHGLVLIIKRGRRLQSHYAFDHSHPPSPKRLLRPYPLSAKNWKPFTFILPSFFLGKLITKLTLDCPLLSTHFLLLDSVLPHLTWLAQTHLLLIWQLWLVFGLNFRVFFSSGPIDDINIIDHTRCMAFMRANLNS